MGHLCGGMYTGIRPPGNLRLDPLACDRRDSALKHVLYGPAMALRLPALEHISSILDTQHNPYHAHHPITAISPANTKPSRHPMYSCDRCTGACNSPSSINQVRQSCRPPRASST
ncbi:hypothetical protein SDC9_140712 [bioreactor metagenome]|uniref:Uncharacterized protein n=1 Tax=bioreactor metagenome TaxID=1076179 RepID=A0A645DYA2_9ZZZZ